MLDPIETEMAITKAIDECYEAWRSGFPSPDERDFVLVAMEVLDVGLSDVRLESLADGLYEAGTSGEVQTSGQMAAWLLERI